MMNTPIKIFCVLLLLSFIGCKKQERNISENGFAESVVSLHNLLEEKNFEEALVLIDSTLKVFPDKPEMYFAKGWVCDQIGDSVGKNDSFKKARFLYEKRIAESHKWEDEVNRVCIAQILFGMDAYRKEVDSLKRIRHQDYIQHPSDSVILENYVYESMKDQMFDNHVELISDD